MSLLSICIKVSSEITVKVILLVRVVFVDGVFIIDGVRVASLEGINSTKLSLSVRDNCFTN